MRNRIWEIRDGRRALITGASAGLGEAFAHLLAEEGWDLALVARREGELHRVAGVLRARHGVEVHVVPADLSRPDSDALLADRLAAKGFAPDVLINNAGFGLVGRATELPADRQLEMIDLNLRAAVALSLRFLPAMADRGRGGVLNVASLAAFMPGPNMAVYFATKAALLSFSEALAEEMAGSGVTVSAFCPGPVRTGFLDASGVSRTWLSRVLRPVRADAVARAGWQGFKEGRTVIVPGLLNTLMAWSARFAPRGLTRRVTRLLLVPRTRRAVDGGDDGDAAGKEPDGGA